MKNKVIILGGNFYTALSAVRSIGKADKDIHIVLMDHTFKYSYVAKSKYIDEIVTSPSYMENEDEFIEFLIKYASKEKEKPIIIPTIDHYVLLIDKYLNKLNKYYLLPKIKQGLYTSLLDKQKLHELATKHNVLLPETLDVKDKDLLRKVKQDIKYPCLVKPKDTSSFNSIFGKKMFVVNAEKELKASIKKAQDANVEVIIQRIIKGFDDHMYTFDAYLNQKSEITHYATFQKCRQFPINFGASSYTIQKYEKEIVDIGSKFLKDIKYKGFAEIEFKKDSETGKFYLIEVNVRITSFNKLLYKLGINIPYITYKDLLNIKTDKYYLTKDTKYAFWSVVEDAIACKDYIKTDQLKRRDILKTLNKKKVYPILDIKDIHPFIEFSKYLLKRLSNKKNNISKSKEI